MDLDTPVLVSVVVPCFNRAHLVGQAVESVRAQTLQAWELLVVDDGSGDDIEAALQPYARDARVRLIRHGRNRGVSAARNTGVAAARGRFVAFLDSDDAWDPRKLELQVAAAQAARDPQRVLCVTQTRVVMPGGWIRIRPLAGPAPGRSFAQYLYSDGGFAQCSSFLVGAQLAREVPFRESLRQYEDHLFFAEAGVRGAEYVLVAQPLAEWRNDDRTDRLGARDSIARAQLFMETARDVLPPPLLQAFQVRALFHLLWRESPWRATALLLRTVHARALPWRQAGMLWTRSLIPGHWLNGVRRCMRLLEPRRT